MFDNYNENEATRTRDIEAEEYAEFSKTGMYNKDSYYVANNKRWFKEADKLGVQMIQTDSEGHTYISCPVCKKKEYVSTSKVQHLVCTNCDTSVKVRRFKLFVRFYREPLTKTGFTLYNHGMTVVDKETGEVVLTYSQYQEAKDAVPLWLLDK